MEILIDRFTKMLVKQFQLHDNWKAFALKKTTWYCVCVSDTCARIEGWTDFFECERVGDACTRFYFIHKSIRHVRQYSHRTNLFCIFF